MPRKRKSTEDTPVYQPIQAKNDTQKEYLKALTTHEMVIVTGPAGTGKTYIAAAQGADWLAQGKLDRIVLSRPNVPSGRDLGHLPGELYEKYIPWLAPFLSAIESRVGRAETEAWLKSGKIQAAPLMFMQGCTFNNAMVLFDEAQNSTPDEMLLFLTRLGQGSQTVIMGDINQTWVRGRNGLETILHITDNKDIPGVTVIDFGLDDIVRSGLVREWLKAFAEYDVRWDCYDD